MFSILLSVGTIVLTNPRLNNLAGSCCNTSRMNPSLLEHVSIELLLGCGQHQSQPLGQIKAGKRASASKVGGIRVELDIVGGHSW